MINFIDQELDRSSKTSLDDSSLADLQETVYTLEDPVYCQKLQEILTKNETVSYAKNELQQQSESVMGQEIGQDKLLPRFFIKKMEIENYECYFIGTSFFIEKSVFE